MVQLPLGVYASGQGPARRFDMTNEAERIELYEIVLTDGTAEDVCRYVNREELLRLWPRLWLPPHVRRYGSQGLVLSPRESGRAA
jgi:hypothetical protein